MVQIWYCVSTQVSFACTLIFAVLTSISQIGIKLLEISSSGRMVKGTLLRIPILVSKFLTNKIHFISKIFQIYYFITEISLLYKFQLDMNRSDSE